MLKSGTDFRQMSQVTLTFGADNKANVDIKLLEMNTADPEDPEIKAVVQEYMSKFVLL